MALSSTLSSPQRKTPRNRPQIASQSQSLYRDVWLIEYFLTFFRLSIEKIMNVTFQSNDGGISPFTAVIDTIQETIHPQRIYQVPVFKDPAGSGYFVDICGFRARAKELKKLNSPILQLIDGLINISRLPRHVFVARRAKKAYPVYTIGSEVVVTTPGGPMFKHIELAKVREYLTDYLHEAEILGEKGVSDKLHVRGTSLKTLQLRRPVLYLKNRNVGDAEFWAPVFETEGLDGLYTYAASDRREVKNEYGGKGILVLTRIVAEALKTEKRLKDIYDLRPDRLQPFFWEKLKQNLIAAGTTEINGKSIEFYTSDAMYIGVEYREKEDRYGLFLSDSAQGLEGRIAADFKRRSV
ncbi:MAG: hypothetical protein ACI9EW_000694 [Cellvibrionaceae bacterium]|jgi:hypothetical protein